MKIPRDYDRPISLEALAAGVCRCYKNAFKLAAQAQHLLDAGFFEGCINACRLAVEELSKSHLLTQGASYKDSDTQKWAWLWSAFRDHREKLRIIEYEIHWPKYQDTQTFHDRVTVLRELREDAVYVQFDASSTTFRSPEGSR